MCDCVCLRMFSCLFASLTLHWKYVSADGRQSKSDHAIYNNNARMLKGGGRGKGEPRNIIICLGFCFVAISIFRYFYFSLSFFSFLLSLPSFSFFAILPPVLQVEVYFVNMPLKVFYFPLKYSNQTPTPA